MTQIDTFRRDALVHNMTARAEAAQIAVAAKAFDVHGAARAADALANAQTMTSGPGTGQRVLLAAPTNPDLRQPEIARLLQQLQQPSLLEDEAGLVVSERSHQALQHVALGALGWNDTPLSAGLQPVLEHAEDGSHTVAVLPGGERIVLPTQSELDAARGLLENAPELSAAADRMAKMDEGERLIQFATDPRFAYMLLIISMLIRMVASQREQGAAMLQFSERSVQAMGEAMVAGAQERRTGAIIGLVTVVAIGAAGVGLGGYAAKRSISNIKANQGGAAKLSGEVTNRHLNGVRGKSAEGGKSEAQNHSTAQNNQKEPGYAEHLQARYAHKMSQNSVIQQGGMAVNTSAQSAAQIANAEYDVRAAEEMRIQETQRQNSETGRKINENVTEQSRKGDEERKMTFEMLKQILQAEYEARSEIARNLR